jgi:hypothetical protein
METDIEVAPSVRLEMLMGTTLDVEDNTPDVSKFNVPDPTTVEVPVAPVMSVEGTEAVYVQVLAAVFV